IASRLMPSRAIRTAVSGSRRRPARSLSSELLGMLPSPPVAGPCAASPWSHSAAGARRAEMPQSHGFDGAGLSPPAAGASERVVDAREDRGALAAVADVDVADDERLGDGADAEAAGDVEA